MDEEKLYKCQKPEETFNMLRHEIRAFHTNYTKPPVCIILSRHLQFLFMEYSKYFSNMELVDTGELDEEKIMIESLFNLKVIITEEIDVIKVY